MPRILLPSLSRLPRSAVLLLPVMILATVGLLYPNDPRVGLLGLPAPDLPGTVNQWWVTTTGGLATLERSRWTMYPATVDRLAQMGFPLDAMMAAPLLKIFGWPTGFNLAIGMFFVGSGVSAGILGWRWWGSGAAGVVTGVLYLSSSVWLREIAQGRASHLAGAVFLPVAVLFCVAAVGVGRDWVGADRDRQALRWRAWLCGAAMAAAALTYWYWGLFVLLAVGMVLVLAAVERLPVFSTLLHAGLGAIAVAGIPMIYMLGRLDAQPGLELGLFDEVVAMDKSETLGEILGNRSLFGVPTFEGLWVTRVVAVVLCALALWRTPARRVALPMLLLLFGWWCACGVYIDTGDQLIPTPYRALLALPVVKRLWWPDRFLFLAALGFAILAGGGAARISMWAPRLRLVTGLVLPALLLAEVWSVQPNLPLPMMVPDAERVRVLKRREGAFLILPGHLALKSYDKKGTQILWDPTSYTEQPFVGRPTVAGNMDPASTMAPEAYARAALLAGPSALLDCETSYLEVDPGGPRTRTVSPGQVTASLALNDITVYVDYQLAAASDYGTGWRSCVERYLGLPLMESPRFGVYPPLE